MYLRCERQTLRRLGRTGGVVFGIRTYMAKVLGDEGGEGLVGERGVPGRLAGAVRGWGEEVKRYKGWERYGEVLLGVLDRDGGRQATDKEEDEEEKDEEDRFPF